MDRETLYQLGQLVGPVDRDTGDAEAALFDVVIHECHRLVVRADAQGDSKLTPCITGAVDDDLLAVAAKGRQHPERRPHEEPAAHNVHNGQQPVDQERPARDVGKAQEEDQRAEHPDRNGDRNDNSQDSPVLHVSDHRAV